MTTAAPLDIARTRADDAALEAYAGLLGEVFGPGPKFTPAALAWRYRDNPAGEVVGFDAWSDGRLGAHYVTCPLEARVEGATLRGLLSLNTATHPDFQGQGLFVKLAEATYRAGAEAGFDFVVGVANANSTPGFIRRLGFQLAAPLAAGWRPLAPSRFARPEPQPQYEAIWTPRSLAWRLANPAGRYRVARRGELLAVWARTHLPLVDCLAAIPFVAPPAGLARPSPAASLFVGLEPRLRLTGLGLVALPDRLRPSPLNLIWRPLSARAPRLLDPAAVAFSFLDFDPY